MRCTDAATILFCGTLSYRPNADAVRFFVTAVLPEIRRAIPETRLVIVGRAPAPDIQALHDGNGVVVASNVPSVTEYYANAAIAIVPLRLGGGTRLKILEAWAHGVPVVSTSIGCEGIGGIDGHHLLVADGAGNFAGRCIAFLRSADLRERIAKQAWQLVSEQYRWEHIRVRAISHVAPLLASGPEPQKLGEYTSPSDRRLQ